MLIILWAEVNIKINDYNRLIQTSPAQVYLFICATEPEVIIAEVAAVNSLPV
jgi:hypothetical protein